jgi:hypothetical protein
MNNQKRFFENNYAGYCQKLAKTDLASRSEILGVEYQKEKLMIPLFGTLYFVSKDGIVNTDGTRPDYAICVILAQYTLLCPEKNHLDPEWIAFRDLKKISHFTNVNYFQSDTEQPIAHSFTGKKGALLDICASLHGGQYAENSAYDVACTFQALPKISLLLLFNDRDEDFPADCSVLFQRQAEQYLDPESLAMTSALLARTLRKMI